MKTFTGFACDRVIDATDQLLGICFLRGVPEDVVGEIGEGEKGAVERCGEAGRLLLAPTEDECECGEG
jgi:hypothetical protein